MIRKSLISRRLPIDRVWGHYGEERAQGLGPRGEEEGTREQGNATQNELRSRFRPVLPDCQGLGTGMALLGAVADHEARTKKVSIVTCHPAMIAALSRHAHWRCVRVQPCGRPHAGLLKQRGVRAGSVGRMTASFRYVGHPRPERPERATDEHR